jgi:V/A-type H+-transporting ATPase subunit I
MAIVPLVKATLYGPIEVKDLVLDELQASGCAHLVNLTPGTGEGNPERGYSKEAYEALKYLRSSPIRRRQARETHDFDYEKIDREALELRRQQQLLEDERDELRRREKALEPWGEFVLPPNSDLAGHRLWFYRLPHRQVEALREIDLTWEAVASDARFEYVVVVAPEQPMEVPVTPIELDPRGLTAVRTRLEEIDSELEAVLWKRAELTRWCRLLERNLDAADDEAVHRHASAQTLDVDRVFALQAWIAEKEVPFLEDLASRHGLAMTYQSPDPTEVPPTKLENTGPVRGGEAAVSFYITPEYRTWDPSVVMYFSFAVFFGMIMSDAGYGLILAILLAAFWRRLGQTDERRRLRSLCVALAVASVAYGAMVGSYFGIRPSPDSILARLQVPLLDPANQAAMMSLSIIIGAAHLAFANLITAWRYGTSIRCLAPLGWCAMILGGLIAGFEWQTRFDPHGRLIPLDIALLVGGTGFVLLFSSARPWSLLPKALILRLFDGLKALTGVSQAFGDVLSYLRIFALGLASSQLAVTFNDLAGRVLEYPGFGILLAVGVILVGHALNFVLAVMSGVVHGLRLNYIEFFNWSLDEEGYSFRPFAKKAST